MQTRDQKYAVDILDKVSKVSKEKKEYQNIYGGMSHKLPILIRTAGLALSEYIRLTQQVMAALLWYKRFAQSVLGVDESDRDDSTSNKGV